MKNEHKMKKITIDVPEDVYRAASIMPESYRVIFLRGMSAILLGNEVEDETSQDYDSENRWLAAAMARIIR